MNNLYIYNSMIIDHEHYVVYMKLLKVLYRLEIIDEDATIGLAMEFKNFVV